MNISIPSGKMTPASLNATEKRSSSAQMITFGAILVSFWAFRFTFNGRKAQQDARAVLLASCFLYRSALIKAVHDSALQWQVRGSLLAWSCAPVIVAWYTWCTLHKDNSISRNEDRLDRKNGSTFPKPLMIPCRTTHSRLFPTKHSFSYSYLYVGIPVGWKGPAGGILSTDDDANTPTIPKTWFSVESEDYLERGVHEQGLEGKLHSYLASQSVSPEDYPYAYLVTAPRFLGFSFNPVSFWYLYDKSKALAAMILEVNNTFDERRMYFMESKIGSDGSKDLGVKFAKEWPKDFHVSPFNDRGGAYSVQSTDPFHLSFGNNHVVDNNIVLKSEDGKPKIIARVFSTESAVDARTMTTWDTLRFVLRWWWVGFMTNPRILKEARTLWAKKLQIYYRPEVLSSSIGRKETPDEVELEVFFNSFLYQLAGSTRSTFRYVAAAGPSRGKEVAIRSNLAYSDQLSYPDVKIHILTPAFYAQLIRYRTLSEAFDRHCFQAAEGEAMIHCTQHEVLREFLVTFSAALQSEIGSTVDWHIVTNLGQQPILQPLWQTLIISCRSDAERRSLTRSSDFDTCVLQSSSRLDVRPYYNIALKLLLADRVAFGWLTILKLEETCVWLILVLTAASSLGDLARSYNCRSLGGLLMMLKFCGVHLWSVLVG